MNGRNYLSGLALSGALLVLPTTSQAALIFDLQEVGANVVLTASGSIDLTGLGTPSSSTAVAGAFFASAGSGPPVIVGAGSGAYDLYSLNVVTGPTGIGTGTYTISSASTGGTVGFERYSGAPFSQLLLPAGYQSGGAVSSSSTFNNHSFSSLGVTPGVHVWTFANNDTITLRILAGSSVPDANTTVTLISLAVTALVGLRRRGLARVP